MTKDEFIKLFEIEKVYEKCKSKIPFCFGLHDNLTGTENSIFYVFSENKVKVVVECDELSEKNKKQRLEFHVILNNDKVELNKDEIFICELFPFLTFDTNFEASLKFIANFINKILIPKYQLMGGVSTY